MVNMSFQKIESIDQQPVFMLFLSWAVFLGACLLFGIEPLTGKIITPVLGGASEVWIVCLLFFQMVVLGGYFLTFLLSRLERRMQVILYILLFAISLIWARIPSADGWVFSSQHDPTWALLGALTAHLSVPCIILSSISGTMQVWQARSGSGDPYRLYSLSNLGSLGALLAYPTLIEPQFPVSATLSIWEAIYFVLFAVAFVASVYAWRTIAFANVPKGAVQSQTAPAEDLNPRRIARWLFLSTLGSAGLLAFTSYITTDVAPVPLLWVLPLAIYLLTFVIAFGRSQMKTDLLIQTWIPMVIAEPISMGISPVVVLVVNLVLLFQLCMVTNAELSNSKPDARHLPTFYLAIAIGGALGGILVALVAPLCFSFAGERSVVILVFTIYQLFAGAASFSKRRLVTRIVIAVLTGIALLAWLIFPTPDIVHRERNFFGSISVKHEGEMVTLYHGRVKHGQQFLDPQKAEIDVYPYGPPAALIFAFLHNMHAPKPIEIGVIGLGSGSMAVEAAHGDGISFYEIDPKIRTIAEKWFSYLAHSHAHVDVQVGDGRLLVGDSQKTFDAICIDAFSGDAVPVHLLTVEAMNIYLRHLKPDGVVFFHITNAYLDLAPIIGNVANFLHLSGCELTYGSDIKYVALSRDPAIIQNLISFADKESSHFSSTKATTLPTRSDLHVWTDDYSNLFSVLKWHN
jgi:SAM-dependent methyltransferase